MHYKLVQTKKFIHQQMDTHQKLMICIHLIKKKMQKQQVHREPQQFKDQIII